jgi:nitrogen fixation protein
MAMKLVSIRISSATLSHYIPRVRLWGKADEENSSSIV